MSAPRITLEELSKMEPCADGMARVEEILPKGRLISATEAREAGATLGDILWVASKMAEDEASIAHRLRMWSADCAAHVLHIYESQGASDAPRRAIIAARQFANGHIDLTAAQNASLDAWDAAQGAWSAEETAARNSAQAAALSAAQAAAWAARAAELSAGEVGRVARDAERAAQDAALFASWDARAVALAAEKLWQFDRLCLWLSDNEPEPLALSTGDTRVEKSEQC